MKVLLLSVPSRKRSLVPPFGLLQVGAILEGLGHQPKVIDPILDDPDLQRFGPEALDHALDSFEPDIVGYSGIATSYGRTKQLALHIRNKYPNIIQMAGGPLASVCDLLLTRAMLDVVVHGEAEVSLPLLLERFSSGPSVGDVPGISFRYRDGEVVRNAPAKQVECLDDLPLPAYHLVEFPRYFRRQREQFGPEGSMLLSDPNAPEILHRIGTDDRWTEVMTGRGCTHRCLFCYRHLRGVRYFSAGYVIRHLEFLMQRYGIRGFQFADELFNANKSRVLELCDAIEENRLDIFYDVGGARVDKVDEAMLRRLKETGCVAIAYGQESGSNTILKEYAKGVTAERNLEVTLLTKQIGIKHTVQLVIGAPSETDETIQETMRFLRDAGVYSVSCNYLIPLPETRIWTFVKERNLIPDVEAYLDQVADQGGGPLVNLTKAPDRQWREWGSRIYWETEMIRYKHAGQPLRYAKAYLKRKMYPAYRKLPSPVQKLAKVAARVLGM